MFKIISIISIILASNVYADFKSSVDPKFDEAVSNVTSLDIGIDDNGELFRFKISDKEANLSRKPNGNFSDEAGIKAAIKQKYESIKQVRGNEKVSKANRDSSEKAEKDKISIKIDETDIKGIK